MESTCIILGKAIFFIQVLKFIPQVALALVYDSRKRFYYTNFHTFDEQTREHQKNLMMKAYNNLVRIGAVLRDSKLVVVVTLYGALTFLPLLYLSLRHIYRHELEEKTGVVSFLNDYKGEMQNINMRVDKIISRTKMSIQVHKACQLEKLDRLRLRKGLVAYDMGGESKVSISCTLLKREEEGMEAEKTRELISDISYDSILQLEKC